MFISFNFVSVTITLTSIFIAQGMNGDDTDKTKETSITNGLKHNEHTPRRITDPIKKVQKYKVGLYIYLIFTFNVMFHSHIHS